MVLTRNVAKERLEQGKVALGLQVRFVRSVEIARAAASRGYHYLNLDLEHSTIDLDACAAICAAALDAGITTIVRVPSHEGFHATRILDGGAQGIIVPHVETAAEARAIVENCRFPPFGKRSPGGSPIQLAWASMPAREVAEALNRNLLLGVIIESEKGVENIDEIAAVPGLDFISVGTNDLTQDMGIPDEFEHPRLMDAYNKIVAAAKRNGKHVRLGNFSDPVLLAKNVEMGARLVTVSSDLKILLQGLGNGIGALSKRLDSELL